MYVCDTAVGRVCVISPTSSLSSYLEQNDVICKTFGIHLRGMPPEVVNITQALDKLRGVSSCRVRQFRLPGESSTCVLANSCC